MGFLKRHLQLINDNLPAACYLPIMAKDCRNYMVLKVVPDESRLFITATKAPYLICIEVF